MNVIFYELTRDWGCTTIRAHALVIRYDRSTIVSAQLSNKFVNHSSCCTAFGPVLVGKTACDDFR